VQLPAGAVGGAVRLDPFGDGVEHRCVVVLRPFGVQPDDVLCAQLGAALGQGVDVFGDRFGSVEGSKGQAYKIILQTRRSSSLPVAVA